MEGKLRLRLLALWAALSLPAAAPAVALAQPAPPVLEVAVPSAVRPGEEFQVAVRATNPGPASMQSSISLSFPERPAVSVLSSSPTTGANSYARVFNPGDPIRNFALDRTVPAQYPLAELFLTGTWPSGQQRFLTVAVRAPENATTVSVQARVTFRGGNGRLSNYPATSDQRDQQGFPVAVTAVAVSATAGAPTAAPTTTITAAPSPSPPPAPTATRPPPTPTPAPRPSNTPAPTNTPAAAAVATGAATPSPAPVDPAAGPGTAWWTSVPPLPLALAGGGLLLLAFVLLSSLRPRSSAGETQRLPVVPLAAPPAVPVTAPLPTVSPAAVAPVGAASGLPPGYEAAGPAAPGRLGPVYRAYQTKLDRYVTLKLIAPALAASEGFAARFAALLPRVARLEHPNIATVFDAGEADGSPFLITEWVQGVSLREVLARLPGPMRLARALLLAEQIAAALDYAHGQLVAHGDLHPGNIIVGLGDSASVTDFGFADLAGPGRAEPLANLDYLAPERFRGGAPDRCADLYALGAIVYELLAGAPPPPATRTLAEAAGPNLPFPPGLPAELAAVIRRALSAEPAARYPSGGEFIAALRAAAGEEG